MNTYLIYLNDEWRWWCVQLWIFLFVVNTIDRISLERVFLHNFILSFFFFNFFSFWSRRVPLSALYHPSFFRKMKFPSDEFFFIKKIKFFHKWLFRVRQRNNSIYITFHQSSKTIIFQHTRDSPSFSIFTIVVCNLKTKQIKTKIKLNFSSKWNIFNYKSNSPDKPNNISRTADFIN